MKCPCVYSILQVRVNLDDAKMKVKQALLSPTQYSPSLSVPLAPACGFIKLLNSFRRSACATRGCDALLPSTALAPAPAVDPRPGCFFGLEAAVARGPNAPIASSSLSVSGSDSASAERWQARPLVNRIDRQQVRCCGVEGQDHTSLLQLTGVAGRGSERE